mmetsp:Transcript_36229/g.90411  ORF Transcript_36229/g.90411 Transcript_36229/m.90411 type:complete len:139 (-) Transcript_36229:2166-2582(-)
MYDGDVYTMQCRGVVLGAWVCVYVCLGQPATDLSTNHASQSLQVTQSLAVLCPLYATRVRMCVCGTAKMTFPHPPDSTRLIRPSPTPITLINPGRHPPHWSHPFQKPQAKPASTHSVTAQTDSKGNLGGRLAGQVAGQ